MFAGTTLTATGLRLEIGVNGSAAEQAYATHLFLCQGQGMVVAQQNSTFLDLPLDEFIGGFGFGVLFLGRVMGDIRRKAAGIAGRGGLTHPLCLRHKHSGLNAEETVDVSLCGEHARRQSNGNGQQKRKDACQPTERFCSFHSATSSTRTTGHTRSGVR